jgi:speckle-type POZ protein
MKESTQTSIRLNDVDAKVFEVLLYYMYKDCLPEFMEETSQEAVNITQHLLVAADRYAMERLKLICEAKLSKTLDVNTLVSP